MSTSTPLVSALYATTGSEATMGSKLAAFTAREIGSESAATLRYDTVRNRIRSACRSQRTTVSPVCSPPYPMLVAVRAIRLTSSISRPSIPLGIS